MWNNPDHAILKFTTWILAMIQSTGIVVIVVSMEEFYCSHPGCIQSGESVSCIFMPIHYFIVLNMVPINILEFQMKLESQPK